MRVESAVRVLAGTMVLIGIGLSVWVHSLWILLSVFVGLNLIQSAFTGICPAAWIFKKLGLQ